MWFRTPNLTPSLGQRAQQVSRPREVHRALSTAADASIQVSPMPWESFGKMNEQDLGALYEFLHSLRPQHGPTGDPRFKEAG